MNPLLLTFDPDRPLLRMDLVPQTSNDVRELFLGAAERFEGGIEENIDFDPGYQLQNDECFQIADFPISDEILTACRQPIATDRLDARDLGQVPIKSIVGFDFSNGQRRLFFQNFDSRRILIPGSKYAVWATADASTFQQLDQPVVLLEANLAAIWDNGLLKFKKFHLAKQIFDLSPYFTEATNEQIRAFSGHPNLACSDSAQLVAVCNSWTRKKIALILRSGVIDCMDVPSVKAAAQAVEYQIPMDGDRILLPLDKRELRELLQFLDEDIYRGPISQRRLLSSGKREIQ